MSERHSGVSDSLHHLETSRIPWQASSGLPRPLHESSAFWNEVLIHIFTNRHKLIGGQGCHSSTFFPSIPTLCLGRVC